MQRGSFEYEIQWRPGVAPAGTPAERRWIVFLDEGGVGLELAKRLEAAGGSCLRVVRSAGAPSARPDAGPNRVAIDADEGAAFRRQLAQQLDGAGSVGVVYAWPLDAREEADAGVEGEAFRLACARVVDLVRVLAIEALVDEAALWLVTAGSQPVAGRRVEAVMQAPVWGLGRVVRFEHPELRCRRVDLDPRAGAILNATWLAGELAASDDEDEVGWREGARYVPRLVARAPIASAERRWAADRPYLITGAFGYLGSRLAGRLVERGARRLALAGRGEPTPRARERVAALRARGATISVHRADVSDADQVDRVIAEAEAAGPLAGVFHLAGSFDDRDLLDLDEGSLRAVMAGRGVGAHQLDRATAGRDLDLFVAFSSSVAVLGAPGQGAFAASNSVLQALAHRRRAQGRPALCIDWGPWHDSAAGISDAVASFDVDSGFAVLERLVGTQGTQVLAVPQDLARLLEFYPRAGRVPIFSEIVDVSRLGAAPGYDRGPLASEYVAPRDRTERVIATVVARMLAIDRVGVRDDFFELGGDSVTGAGILDRVNRLLGAEITFGDAIEAFSVERLASLVRASSADPRAGRKRAGRAEA